jgi:hypothetical protein
MDSRGSSVDEVLRITYGGRRLVNDRAEALGSSVDEVLRITDGGRRLVNDRAQALVERLCRSRDGPCLQPEEVIDMFLQQAGTFEGAQYIEAGGPFFAITGAFVPSDLHIIDPELFTASLAGDTAAQSTIYALVHAHFDGGATRFAVQLVSGGHCSALLVCAPAGNLAEGRAYHIDTLSVSNGTAWHAAEARERLGHLCTVLRQPARDGDRLATLLAHLGPLARLPVRHQQTSRNDCVVASLLNLCVLPGPGGDVGAIRAALRTIGADDYARGSILP